MTMSLTQDGPTWMATASETSADLAHVSEPVSVLVVQFSAYQIEVHRLQLLVIGHACLRR